MSDNKFKCGCPKDFYKKTLAEAEDWENKKKEKMREILAMDKDPDCPSHKELAPGEQRSTWLYSTGGRGDTYLACPHGCGKMYKKVTEYGDELELEHECRQSNQISNQSKQTNKSFTGHTHTHTHTERERERERESNSAKTNYLPYILGGIAILGLIGLVVYFFTRKEENK